MNIKIGTRQVDKLKSIIQNLINSTLESIRQDSEEWGLGEMDELDEINSIDKIVINRITTVNKIKVYIDIYRNSNRYDFDNIRAELQYRINKWIPNIEIYLNDIIDDREFGPGIDW
jgi:hypothetical protein